MCRSIIATAWLARGDSTAGSLDVRVPDETLTKQYPFNCENVVKQIAAINALDQTTGGDS
jgi:hypothetical protein